MVYSALKKILFSEPKNEVEDFKTWKLKNSKKFWRKILH